MDAVEAGIDYLIINTTQPPMTDVRVRRAFNHVDRQRGLGQLAQDSKAVDGIYTDGISRDTRNRKATHSIPKKRAKLLAEAGYPVTKTRRQFFVSEVSGRSGGIHLQHAGIEQSNGGVDAGPMETKPGHHYPAAKYGLEDISERRSEARLSKDFRAAPGVRITWIRLRF